MKTSPVARLFYPAGMDGEKPERSSVQAYLERCRRLPAGPIDRRELVRLAAAERAAKREWGEPARVRRKTPKRQPVRSVP